MARVTVEDCLEAVDNQYDLIILAKERTLQIGRACSSRRG